MAQEILAAGYGDIRDYIAEQWDHFEFRYLGDSKLVLAINDPRVTTQVMDDYVRFTIMLAQTDEDVAAMSAPRRIDELVTLQEQMGTEVDAKAFATFDFDVDESVTVQYGMRVPTEGIPGPPGPEGPPGPTGERGHSTVVYTQSTQPDEAVQGDIWIIPDPLVRRRSAPLVRRIKR